MREAMKTPAQILEEVREADCPPGGRARAEHVIAQAMADARRAALEEAAKVLDERARMHHSTANLGQPGYSVTGVALGNVAAELRALSVKP